jgi:hypothetical protein
MSWNYDEIAQEWLGGSVIAVPPEEVVAAFDRCEQAFGRDWISQSRGTIVGASPTLHIVTMGQRLASLAGVGATEQLLEKLTRRESSAAAELHAIHLLRSTERTSLELFPKAIVGGREREPDFRIRRDDDLWVYAEVTHTDISEAYERAHVVLDTLSAVIESITRPFDLEVFLRREPTDAEVNEALPGSCASARPVAPAEMNCPMGWGCSCWAAPRRVRSSLMITVKKCVPDLARQKAKWSTAF